MYERIIVKPHPRNINDPIITLFESLGLNTEICYGEIDDLLNQGPTVYTLYSTVGYEAMLRGLNVVIIGSKGYQTFKEYLEGNRMKRIGQEISRETNDLIKCNNLEKWMNRVYQ